MPRRLNEFVGQANNNKLVLEWQWTLIAVENHFICWSTRFQNLNQIADRQTGWIPNLLISRSANLNEGEIGTKHKTKTREAAQDWLLCVSVHNWCYMLITDQLRVPANGNRMTYKTEQWLCSYDVGYFSVLLVNTMWIGLYVKVNWMSGRPVEQQKITKHTDKHTSHIDFNLFQLDIVAAHIHIVLWLRLSFAWTPRSSIYMHSRYKQIGITCALCLYRVDLGNQIPIITSHVAIPNGRWTTSTGC